jgi:phosphatidylserine synthase
LFYAYASFTYIEYSLFSAIFLIHIQNFKFRKIILVISIAFFLFLILYYSAQNNFLNIDSVPIGVETILILVYAFYYLYEQMNDLENSFIYNKYHFWLVIGIMLYLSGSFFIYVFANQVDDETLRNFWYLTNVFYVIKNILFGIALLILFKQSKVSSPKSHKKMYPYLN